MTPSPHVPGRAVALLLAVFVALLSAAVVYPARAADELSEIGERTFSTIAGCASTADSVLVAIVVDESSSLRLTDPTDLRVGAIEAAIDSLESVQEASGGRVSVEASLATFSGEYSELVAWGAVEGNHAAALLDAARNVLPSRDSGDFTDYWSAPVGAQRSLEKRHAELGGTSCKLVLWFTDGELDVPGGGEAEAYARLCDPLGLVDGIRSAGIAVIAAALFTDEGSSSVGQDKREELRAIAEGTGAGTRCGQELNADAGPGAYLRADEPSGLRRLFAGIGARIEGGTGALSTVCPADLCPEGSLEIPLDAGVAGFRAIIDGQPGIATTLVAPGGSELEMEAGSTTLEGADIRVDSRDGLTVLSVADSGGVGGDRRWILHSGASLEAPAVLDLYYFWGVSLSVEAPDGLVIGEPSPVEVRARYSNGTPVDPSVYQRFDLALQASGLDVPLQPFSDGVATGTMTIPAGSAPASTDFSAVADATSTANQLQLGPIRTAYSVQTTLPAAFPTLQSSALPFPALMGDSTSSISQLVLTGSDRGSTQACWDPGQIDGPSGAGELVLSSEQECVTVPANEEVAWDFELTAANPADGDIRGGITLTLHAVDNQETIDVQLPVTGSMMRPVDEIVRWELTIALIALALLISGAILVVSNLMTGFVIGPRTRTAEVPVVLSAAGLRRRGGGELFQPDDFSFRHAKDQRVSGLTVGGLRFSRRLPFLGLGEPEARVEAPPGELVVATHRRASGPTDGSWAPVDFGLGSNLYLALPRAPGEGSEYSGRLVTVVEDHQKLMDALNEMVESNGDIWAATHERLSAAAQQPEGATVGPEGAPPGVTGQSRPDPEEDDGPPSVFERRTHTTPADDGPPPERGRGRDNLQPGSRPGDQPRPGFDDGRPPSIFDR